ncbi:hypothetical protein SAMN05216238_10124 [Lentibacillus persicus]|uniref:Uncharacterized protein n=1 Tax=Lentibacillus persicus TaxID=640948 RepID=A0A1I1RRH9_9BACI|nr:hypothetical protein SAMN05216238_10124 [Lentibacillus persicus]
MRRRAGIGSGELKYVPESRDMFRRAEICAGEQKYVPES